MVQHRWTVYGVLAVAAILAPVFLTGGYNRAILASFWIYVLLLTGISLITGFGQMIHLGQGGLFGLGAYTAGVAVVRLEWPPELALLLAPAAVGAVTAVVAVPALRLRGLYFAMATLGTGVVLWLLFQRAVGITGGPNGLLGITSLRIGPIDMSSSLRMYILAAILGLLGLFVADNLIGSRWGRALKALGASEPSATSVGVAGFRLRLLVFVVCGVYAGVAGALQTFESRFIDPQTFGFLTSVVLIVGAIVGGLRAFGGPLVGAVILITLEQGLAAYPDAQAVIIGLVFLLAIQRLPEGLMGSSIAEYVRERLRHLIWRGHDKRLQELDFSKEEEEPVGSS